MDKSPDAFRTISEVAELLETPAHVLRFWESRFPQIKPVKRAGGRRYYRPADLALLTGIRRLLHDEGLTIRGVQKILREQGVRHVSGMSDEEDAPDAEFGVDEGGDIAANDPILLFPPPVSPPQARQSDAPEFLPETDAHLLLKDETAPSPGVADADADLAETAPPEDPFSVEHPSDARPEQAAAPETPLAAPPEDSDPVDNIFEATPQTAPAEAHPAAAEAATDAASIGGFPFDGPFVPRSEEPVEEPTGQSALQAEAPDESPSGDPFAPMPDVAQPDTAPPAAALTDAPPLPVLADLPDLPDRDEGHSPAGLAAPAAKSPADLPAPPALPPLTEVTAHWLAADLRALPRGAFLPQRTTALALIQRLTDLRNRVADLGRVPRR